jgi:hypothetical protein
MKATDTMDIDDRIRAALTAQANQITEADLRPKAAPTHRAVIEEHPRRRWAAPLLAAAAVAAVAVGTTVAVHSVKAHHMPPANSPVPGVTVPVAPTSSPRVPSSGPSGRPSTPPRHASRPLQTPPAQPSSFDFGYQPLYPFANLAEAQAWQAANRTGGHQPWHASAELTAISFTTGWLGFQQIDTVTSTRTAPDGAHVGVGYRDASRALHTAAVLHLVRFGADPDSPWEIVGSDDNPASFTLDTPTYGSAVTSPMIAGGHIVGVDENVTVTVRRLSSPTPVGTHCCTPAGMATPTGTDWTATVSFTATPGDVLTIIAQTGGHLQPVERFAIQCVHA